MKIYKIFKVDMQDPYKLYISDVATETNPLDINLRLLNNNEVAQIHSSYPDMLKDFFLKAIILTQIALDEIGIKFYAG